MRWNKVIVRPFNREDRANGTPLYYIAAAELEIGDVVEIETCNGWYKGKITDIVDCNVKHGRFNKKIKKANQEAKNMKKMVLDKFFTKVEVKRANSTQKEIILIPNDMTAAHVGDTIVYKSGDPKVMTINPYSLENACNLAVDCHVGTITDFQSTRNHTGYAIGAVSFLGVQGWLSKVQQAELIMLQLEEKRKAFEQEGIYRALAENDPEAAKLLGALQDLTIFR